MATSSQQQIGRAYGVLFYLLCVRTQYSARFGDTRQTEQWLLTFLRRGLLRQVLAILSQKKFEKMVTTRRHDVVIVWTEFATTRIVSIHAMSVEGVANLCIW